MREKHFLAPWVTIVCSRVKLINVYCFINLKPSTRIHIHFGEPSGACWMNMNYHLANFYFDFMPSNIECLSGVQREICSIVLFSSSKSKFETPVTGDDGGGVSWLKNSWKLIERNWFFLMC